jgi:hypothetical protein
MEGADSTPGLCTRTLIALCNASGWLHLLVTRLFAVRLTPFSGRFVGSTDGSVKNPVGINWLNDSPACVAAELRPRRFDTLKSTPEGPLLYIPGALRPLCNGCAIVKAGDAQLSEGLPVLRCQPSCRGSVSLFKAAIDASFERCCRVAALGATSKAVADAIFVAWLSTGIKPFIGGPLTSVFLNAGSTS